MINPLGLLPIFSQGRSGRLYGPKPTLLMLGKIYDGYEFYLPCWIEIQSNRQLTVYAVDGLPDTVKMDMGVGGFKINITTALGDYDVRLIYKAQGKFPLVAIDSIHDLCAYFRTLSKPVEATDKEGLLGACGIQYIYITDVHLTPMQERPGAYIITLNCLSELAHDMGVTEFLTKAGSS